MNPVQTEILYNKAITYAGLTGKEKVIDAYCGTGTIGLIAASQAKEVIGVELNRDAVKDAVINAKRNNIKNEQFYNADAGKFMVELSEQNKKWMSYSWIHREREAMRHFILSCKTCTEKSGLRVLQPGDTCEGFKISHKTWISGCRVPALRHVSVHETCRDGCLAFQG